LGSATGFLGAPWGGSVIEEESLPLRRRVPGAARAASASASVPVLPDSLISRMQAAVDAAKSESDRESGFWISPVTTRCAVPDWAGAAICAAGDDATRHAPGLRVGISRCHGIHVLFQHSSRTMSAHGLNASFQVVIGEPDGGAHSS